MGALAAWLVHAYTASGAVIGLLALEAVWRGDVRAAFLWFIAATAVDASDGVLARAARVRERMPQFDGARIDDLVDYVTFVLVPAALLIHVDAFPPAIAMGVAGAMLVASAFGFSRVDAKTADHFFTGFPSYWNIVAFYLYAGRLPQAANAAIVLILCVLVFAPIGFVYPTRTVMLRRTTLATGCLWAALVLWMVWRLPDVSPFWLLVSLIYPAYYALLSLWLHRGRHGS